MILLNLSLLHFDKIQDQPLVDKNNIKIKFKREKNDRKNQ